MVQTWWHFAQIRSIMVNKLFSCLSLLLRQQQDEMQKQIYMHDKVLI